MIFGSPIIISEGNLKRDFVPLNAISARRDDTNSFQETLLQELVDGSPQVLPIREYLPSSKALFSLGREVQVDLGGGQGFIDNLLVTNDGYLVIVETKLYRNPEATREVITQTMQYGMAVGYMSLRELEDAIRKGQNPAITSGESITDTVFRLATEQNISGLLPDDFEEALERHLRRGEILLLVVSDGIHIGVERVTHWLNGQGNSSPFKFGLVEMKFYTVGNNRLVIPRTVLKTQEVSRHVVVVDVRRSADVIVTTQVTDVTSSGGAKNSRSVKAASVPLDKNQLLELVSPEDKQAFTQLVEQLELYNFVSEGTGSYLKFGFRFPEERGDYHPLVYLGKGGVWVQPLKQLRDLLGAENIVILHKEANQFGRFYRDDQLDKPDSFGCEVKYRQLANGFAAFLDGWRIKTGELLKANDGM